MPARKKPPTSDKQRENSGIANLIPYQPGQSGNPNGRPKRKTISERLDDLLGQSKLPGLKVPDGQCVADVLAAAIIKQACKGKFPFAKEVIDRLEGKVPDRIIDETPDASVERDRAEFASLLAALRERAGIAPPEGDHGPPEPGRNGDGHQLE